MPIKFRCQHCQQFLGIAQSRAGAIVDCPQCGRSLRVPELDGRTRKMPDARSEAKADSSLMSALSELSALGDAWESAAAEDRSGQSEQQTVREPQAPVRQSVPEPRAVVAEAMAVRPVPAAQIDGVNDADRPIELDDSLSELVAFGEDVSATGLSEDLLTEMQQVSHPSRSPLLTIFGGLLMLLVGGAVGWWLASSRILPTNVAEPDGRAVMAAEGPVPPLEVPPLEVQPARDGAVSGTVRYLDAAGQSQPDSGALVILLPEQRRGSLKLDARSLQHPADHPDRIATLAALTSFGGAVTVVDVQGRYQLTGRTADNFVVVAVSRHRQRPADVSTPADVTETLQAWFDSSSNICGRLAAKIATVPGSEGPQDFLFRE